MILWHITEIQTKEGFSWVNDLVLITAMRKLASQVKLLAQTMDTDEILTHTHLVLKFLPWVSILQISWSYGLEYSCAYMMRVSVNVPFLVKTCCCQRQHNMPSNSNEATPRNKKWIPSVYQWRNSVMCTFKQFRFATFFCYLWFFSHQHMESLFFSAFCILHAHDYFKSQNSALWL